MNHLNYELKFPDNDPRYPCVLILDTSASMKGAPIDALNEGLSTFQEEIRKDDLAQRRVESAIVTFGNGEVQIVQDFGWHPCHSPTMEPLGPFPQVALRQTDPFGCMSVAVALL